MKIRFQADADFNQHIVRAVRRQVPTVDFLTAHDAGLVGLDDVLVLEKAAQERRVLVSHNRRTMPFHFATFIETKTSVGVILVSQDLPVRRAAEDLILIWETSEAEEWVNQIGSIPL